MLGTVCMFKVAIGTYARSPIARLERNNEVKGELSGKKFVVCGAGAY